MPAIKVFPQDVDRKLTEVFTKYGYDGASMELLAQATGLKKASLYHRFPGGKRDMAAHVLKNVGNWFQTHVGAVLADKTLSTSQRLDISLKNIMSQVDDGASNCSLRMLSACSETAYFRQSIEDSFVILLDGFTNIGVENGLDEALARVRARQAVITIQGSLVLARGLNDTAIFKQSVEAIPSLLGSETKS